VIVTYRTG